MDSSDNRSPSPRRLSTLHEYTEPNESIYTGDPDAHSLHTLSTTRASSSHTQKDSDYVIESPRIVHMYTVAPPAPAPPTETWFKKFRESKWFWPAVAALVFMVLVVVFSTFASIWGMAHMTSVEMVDQGVFTTTSVTVENAPVTMGQNIATATSTCSDRTCSGDSVPSSTYDGLIIIPVSSTAAANSTSFGSRRSMTSSIYIEGLTASPQTSEASAAPTSTGTMPFLVVETRVANTSVADKRQLLERRLISKGTTEGLGMGTTLKKLVLILIAPYLLGVWR
ncbi:uncharacterized protein LY89DRAFT_768294 [Mollisia scopiformis]|uniref:Uncharacterized protein n=1 Tax=Mollisia scopiformis TaxID=149040 RepID=A0A194XPK4_MOLSC|nr:uncharacterized protein LY89DRAFT_768294 [Mollisia scopiformis]KUJ22004.1 hypothetical protein LY89DRAFT_768294 [Mollisia scopiformis]